MLGMGKLDYNWSYLCTISKVCGLKSMIYFVLFISRRNNTLYWQTNKSLKPSDRSMNTTIAFDINTFKVCKNVLDVSSLSRASQMTHKNTAHTGR